MNSRAKLLSCVESSAESSSGVPDGRGRGDALGRLSKRRREADLRAWTFSKRRRRLFRGLGHLSKSAERRCRVLGRLSKSAERLSSVPGRLSKSTERHSRVPGRSCKAAGSLSGDYGAVRHISLWPHGGVWPIVQTAVPALRQIQESGSSPPTIRLRLVPRSSRVSSATPLTIASLGSSIELG